MATNAYFRIEHSSFNREEWGYGRVANAAHYAANQNKRGEVASIGLPTFDTSYEAKQAFLELEKLQTRKNARLGDTFVICFPNEVKPEHRALFMERFLDKVTFQGKSYAAAWEHTDKPNNPHFHAVLISIDRETGKQIGYFGHARSYRKKLGLEPNVTEWMRMQWEAAGNELFQELGYDLSFDRRSNLERGLEPPGEHRGYQNDNSPEAEDAQEGVEDMADLPERTEEAPSAANLIRNLYDTKRNYAYLRESKVRIEQARKKYESLVVAREQTSFERDVYATSTNELRRGAYTARDTYQKYVRKDGKLKGFEFTTPSFSFFGLKVEAQRFATLTRMEAERAQQELERLAPAAEAAEHSLQQRTKEVDALDQQATDAEREAYMRQKELERTFCGPDVSAEDVDKMLDAREKEFEETISVTARQVSLEDAQEAFLSVQITEDEYEAFLIEGGHREALKQFYADQHNYEIVDDEEEEEGEGL